MECLRSLLLLHRGAQCLASRSTSLWTKPCRNFAATSFRSRSTTQRTKRALNIAPHTSFLGPRSTETDQIVFNPPASAPSVFNTPFVFLPKTDPRRRARLASHLFADSTSPIPLPGSAGKAGRVPGGQEQQDGKAVVTKGGSTSSSQKPQPTATTAADGSPVPPAVLKGPFGPANWTVTKEQVSEIQRLRQNDPAKWTVQKLAKKFNCTASFIMSCGAAPDAHQQRLRKKLEQLKAKWGPIKRKARLEREKRKKLMRRGEI